MDEHQPVASRFTAIVEVVVAFAVMHTVFRAFKHFTSLGRLEVQHGMQFSPGVSMLVVAVGLTFLFRRSLRSIGIRRRVKSRDTRFAVTFIAIFVVLGVVSWLLGLRGASAGHSVTQACVLAGLNIAATVMLLVVLNRFRLSIRAIPIGIVVGVLLLGVVAPWYAVFAKGAPAFQQGLHILWIVIGSAIGEEVFFRGYVQGRLNESFGRPWFMLGVRFGPGLFGAALLFGVIHVLNPADYFRGHIELNWTHGLTTATALYFGFLRERTGSVVAPAIVHGWTNLVGFAVR